MPFQNSVKRLSAATLALALGCGLAFAADEQINARHTEMKAYGKAMGALSAIPKGEVPYSAAYVKEHADAILAAYAKAQEAHAWDSDKQANGTVDTYAKPEIWTNKADFDAKYKALAEAATKVAASTDEASFKAAFGGLGATCKSCHETYRKPKS